MIMPKQVGAMAAPRKSKSQRNIVNFKGSKRKKRVTPATDARRANPLQISKACT